MKQKKFEKVIEKTADQIQLKYFWKAKIYIGSNKTKKLVNGVLKMF